MLNKLFTYGKQLNTLQAIAFYFVHFIIGLLIIIVLSSTLEFFNIIGTPQAGLILGNALAVIFSFIIATLISDKKNFFRKYSTYPLLLLNLILSAFGGLLLGLIIPAYLSTKEPFKSTLTVSPTNENLEQ